MTYMAKQPERRSDPEKLLPGAKSVIALAMPYYAETEVQDARTAQYARGRDYHKVIAKRLDAFLRYVEALAPGTRCKTFVDAGPLLERPFAQRAGLGFIGKNTLLITRGLGSWVFLAHVVTTLELVPDAPDLRSCGSCTLCIDACPTQAIRAPFELDARRCISYLTIELEGEIPEALRPKMRDWVFGCDVCQDVCPHNTRIPSTVIPEFKEERKPFALAELLTLEEKTFATQFAGTPFTRTGRAGLVRNACVAAANLGRTDLIPALENLRRKDPDAAVRAHAFWALRQLASRGSAMRSDAKA
jgi:epoxyqueuosine reductase